MPVATTHRQEDAASCEEDILYGNLCLLGVPNAEGAKSLEFSKHMFRRPNAAALNLILYHMYTFIKGKAHSKKVHHLS